MKFYREGHCVTLLLSFVKDRYDSIVTQLFPDISKCGYILLSEDMLITKYSSKHKKKTTSVVFNNMFMKKAVFG